MQQTRKPILARPVGVQKTFFPGQNVKAQHTKQMLTQLEKQHAPRERARTVRAFKGNLTKKALPALRKAVFDLDREVRGEAAHAMAEIIGWEKTIEFIVTRFRTPGTVPAAFYYSTDRIGGFGKKRVWRKQDLAPISERASEMAKEKGLKQAVDEKGKPIIVKGIPVFFKRFSPEDLGTYLEGMPLIESRPKKLRPEDRVRIAWHEFGETFSHETGLAQEIYYLQKRNQLKQFLATANQFEKKEFERILLHWKK